jgi:hypothetical protein
MVAFMRSERRMTSLEPASRTDAAGMKDARLRDARSRMWLFDSAKLEHPIAGAWPSPTAPVHYKRSVTRKRRTRCLDSQTLATLARGSIPSDGLQHVREHLPQCSNCLGTVAAAVRRRALAGPAWPGREAPRLPAGADSSPGRLLRGLAVAISLLALGSSATCWYLDPRVPGKSLSNQGKPAPGVTHGAMTGVE